MFRCICRLATALFCLWVLFPAIGVLPVLGENGGTNRAKLSSNSGRLGSKDSGQIVDMLVAAVDGQPIMLSELKATAQGKTPEGKGKGATKLDQRSLQLALRDLIQEKTLALEAEKNNLQVTEADLKNYVSEVRSRYGLSEARFYEQLERQGISKQGYEREVRRQIIQARVVGNYVRSRISVTDSDIEKYFEEFPERRPKQGQVRISQIFIPSARINASAEYQRIKTEISNGTSPEVAAQPYFQDLGFEDIDSLREDFAAALNGLPVGKISSPVEDDGGVYAFVIRGKAQGPELDPNLKQEVKEKLFERAYEKEASRFLQEELPKLHDIEVVIGDIDELDLDQTN